MAVDLFIYYLFWKDLHANTSEVNSAASHILSPFLILCY